MLDVLAAIHIREQKESNIKSEILALLLSKPVEFRTELPEWEHCIHVDLDANEDWLSPDTLRVMLDNLVGCLVHSCCAPIDICAVKMPGIYSVVVRTDAPSILEPHR